MRSLALAVALLCSAPLAAQEALPPPPPLEGEELRTPRQPLPNVEQALDQGTLEPEVRIVPGRKGLVEEYRLNGRVYMIRVTPAQGPPYYMVDADGDGDLERRSSEFDPRILIPGWVLFRW